MKHLRLLLLVIAVWLVGTLPAAAQGPVVEPPPDVIIDEPMPQRGVTLHLIEERIAVSIAGQVATTRLAQTFRNPSDWALEGEYLFPLPPDAAIRDMDMTVDGVKLEGELMTAEQAREIYEEIVRQKMDPALLEWVGNGLFRTHIFPIPPGETRLIELEYTQLLTPDEGLFQYRFPLRQANIDNVVPDVSISLTLEGEAPLRAIYSPSHDVDILREGEQGATVGWEGRNVSLEEDFSLFWSVSPEEIELNLLSFKEAGEDGFFLLLAAPTIAPSAENLVARDVVIVLDTSGSMEGDKMEQARGALDYILAHLNPADRFNVIAFSTGTRPFAQRMQPASEAAAARRWVAELQPGGSTDISRALLEALALDHDPARPLLLLFLTDGLPTAGIVDREGILSAALQAAPEGTRAFTFGMGYDVDTFLLDGLASALGGTAGYVTPDERIDEEISTFYAKVSAPILSDVALDWGDARVEELYPSPLPDLFAGQQLVLAGRYREAGPLAVTLSGMVNGEKQEFRYDDLRLAGNGESEAGWLPRLWATRKIGTLLQDIRRNGENSEAVEEIIDLAIRYGIVTPYTTFLVDEGETFFSEDERSNLSQDVMPPAAAPEASGAGAVEEAETMGELATSDRAAPAPPSVSQEEGAAEGDIASAVPVLRTIGSKSFVLREGRWVDTRFTEGMAQEEVLFGSADYFALAARGPEVARYLSVGVPLLLVLDGTAYHIIEDPNAPDPTPIVVTVTTPEAQPEPTAEATEIAINVQPDPTEVPVGPTAITEPSAPSRPWLPIAAVAVLVLGGFAAWGVMRQR